MMQATDKARGKPLARGIQQSLVLLLLGLTSLALYLSIAALGNLRGLAALDYLPRYVALFTPYLAVLWLTRSSLSRRASLILWAFAILFRLALLFEPPTLSDDVYRYIWDGRVQTAGVNPYAHRVDSPTLDALATPNRDLVNNPQMASPYLPMAQMIFALVYRLAPESPTAFQVSAALFDLATGALLWSTLRRSGRRPQWALLYLWNPLVIVEAAHGAHVDALMTLLTMAALWQMTARRWPLLSAVLLGLATLVKPIPILLLPALIWRWKWRGGAIYAATVLLGIFSYWQPEAGLGLTGELTGTGMFGATRIYAAQWNFNGGFYHWLEVWLTGYQTPGAVPAGTPGVESARAISGALLLFSLLFIAWRARLARNLSATFSLCPWSIAAYLLLTTTVHPWYLIPLIALLPFAGRQWAMLLPWLYFSASVDLSYLTYLDPLDFRETNWVRMGEYFPLYVLLLGGALWDLARTRLLDPPTTAASAIRRNA